MASIDWRYFDGMTHRLNRWLLVVMVLIAAPFWWLLIDNSPGQAQPKPIHIAELRRLAATLPGSRPTALHYTIVATRRTVGDLFAAGIGLKRRSLAMIAWYLPVPGAGPILIDAAATPADAQASGFRHFDIVKQHQIDTDAARADLILATHLPPNQGGAQPTAYHPLGKTPDPAPPSRGTLTAAAGAAPVAAPRAVAPGVVVIPASDYAPGAQLIFVQLAAGAEFLFTGDISNLDDNWSQLRARSLLAAHWLAPQTRAKVYPWLRTIRQLHCEAPKLTIVPGNDVTWLIKQRHNGKVAELNPGQ